MKLLRCPVQPNLVPPITTVAMALAYRERLQPLAPGVTFLMSLYLHPTITPEAIREAKAAGIVGVKSYPAGVTTNSASGVFDYKQFYPVFATMEEEDMILNLHGEVPSGGDVTVLNAEERFLPTLLDLHARFPKLRIVLEHCTTSAAIEAVLACGPNVAGTITPHHLYLTIDDVVGDPMNFCKPVAKLPGDRSALLRAALSGNPKFFFGTDSAPHPLHAKKGGTSEYPGKCSAGVFTQPYATQTFLGAVALAVEKEYIKWIDMSEDVLKGFLGEYGRAFYKQKPSKEKFKVVADQGQVAETLMVDGKDVIVPFRRGEKVYSIQWV